MDKPINIIRLSEKYRSLSLDKEDLKALVVIIQELANDAGNIEYNKFVEGKSENLEQIRKDIDKCARLFILVIGTNKAELGGTLEEVFSATDFPEEVESIHINTESNYQTFFKYYPSNYLFVLIDFSTPKIFDFTFSPGDQTPNNSQITISGGSTTWVHGTFGKIDTFLKRRPNRFSKVHQANFYSTLIWVIGIPLSFSFCYSFIELKIPFFEQHSFFQNMILVYIFFLTLLLMRILFHYVRWVYPVVEYKTKKSKGAWHQWLLTGITMSIVGKLAWEIGRLLIKG